MPDLKTTARRLPGATDQSGDEAAFKMSDEKCMTTMAGFSRPLPRTLFGLPRPRIAMPDPDSPIMGMARDGHIVETSQDHGSDSS